MAKEKKPAKSTKSAKAAKTTKTTTSKTAKAGAKKAVKPGMEKIPARVRLFHFLFENSFKFEPRNRRTLGRNHLSLHERSQPPIFAQRHFSQPCETNAKSRNSNYSRKTCQRWTLGRKSLRKDSNLRRQSGLI